MNGTFFYVGNCLAVAVFFKSFNNGQIGYDSFHQCCKFEALFFNMADGAKSKLKSCGLDRWLDLLMTV